MKTLTENHLKGLYQEYLKKRNKKTGIVEGVDEEKINVHDLQGSEFEYSTSSLYDDNFSMFVDLPKESFYDE